jgi:hypothetical protein
MFLNIIIQKCPSDANRTLLVSLGMRYCNQVPPQRPEFQLSSSHVYQLLEIFEKK